jgi:hypothetical protein
MALSWWLLCGNKNSKTTFRSGAQSTIWMSKVKEAAEISLEETAKAKVVSEGGGAAEE